MRLNQLADLITSCSLIWWNCCVKKQGIITYLIVTKMQY